MSEQDWLGDVPIYRWDPEAAVDEGEDWLVEGRKYSFVNSEGEIVATAVMGPKTKTVDDEGELWSISLLDVSIEGDE